MQKDYTLQMLVFIIPDEIILHSSYIMSEVKSNDCPIKHKNANNLSLNFYL
jgi:hypothetical protein